jgi:hypothetical protein
MSTPASKRICSTAQRSGSPARVYERALLEEYQGVWNTTMSQGVLARSTRESAPRSHSACAGRPRAPAYAFSTITAAGPATNA